VSADLVERVAKLIALGRSGAQPDRVTAAQILAMPELAESLQSRTKINGR